MIFPGSHQSNGMQAMLQSVYSYLSNFIRGEEDKLRIDRILEAMCIVDRIFFVEDKRYAYLDTAMPLSHGQTISQPSTVARMLLLAMLKPGQDLLEVGSASGWNACICAFLAYPGRTMSVERIPELAEKARSNTLKFIEHLKQKSKEQAQKLANLEFRAKNLFDMKEDGDESYDRIIITAGIEPKQECKLNRIAANLLKQEGLLVCPYTFGPLITIGKSNGKIATSYTREDYVFVPLLE